MKRNISLIGGDLRISILAEMLAKENNVYVYGMENLARINENEKIIKCKNIDDAINSSSIIIGSIPFSKVEGEMYSVFSKEKILLMDLIKNVHKDKIFIAGSIKDDIYKLLNKSYGNVIDIMNEEELVVLNTIATAEGAIEEAIKNTDFILHGSKVLILGFGRVGKVVAKKFSALSCKVTCAVRKNVDFAWIKTLGYDSININNLGENLKDYDIIINTVPKIIIGKDELCNIKKDTLIIDLASSPGGVDRNLANEMNIKVIWALALPGKVAPVSSAYFIKNTIYNLLNKYSH